MNAAHKILTVSYGTFSCTLEGFDDPFNTMKAIAEYFRDLAADDRYFGAEPPQPDAAMLHKIAEREIQRRVEAKIQDNGVVLRARDVETPAPATALPATRSPETPVTAPEPAQAPVSAEVVAKAPKAAGQPLPAVAPPETTPVSAASPSVTLSLAPAASAPQPAPKMLAEDAAAAAMASAAQRLHRLRAAQAAPIAPVVAAPLVAAPVVAAPVAAPEIVAMTTPLPEVVAEPDPIAAPQEADTTEALLTSLRETLSGSLDAEVIAPVQEALIDGQSRVEDAADDAAARLSETLAGITADYADILPESQADAQAYSLPEEATAEDDADQVTDAVAEHAEDAVLNAVLAQAEADADLAIDAEAGAPTEPGHAPVDETEASDQTADRIEAAPLPPETLDTETLDTETPDTEALDTEALEAQADVTAPATLPEALADTPATANSSVSLSSAFLDEIAQYATTFDPVAEPAPMDPSQQDLSQIDTPSLEEVSAVETVEVQTAEAQTGAAELPAPLVAEKIQRARARVIKIRRLEAPAAETAPTETTAEIGAQAPSEAPAVQSPAPQVEPVRADDQATAAAIRSAMTDTQASHRLPAAETDEASVDRLLQKARTEFEEPQTKRRRSAIAHLKAAVLATVAERRARGAAKPDDSLRQDPYRKDLDQVMRPAPASAAQEKPAPLMLLPTLRIDRSAVTQTVTQTAAAPQPAPQAAPSPSVIPRRPVRVQRPAFRPEEDELAAEIAASEVSGAFHDSPKQSFQDFADGLGASSLQDLIEAAGAYLTVTKGEGGFTRPELFAQISALGSEPSREDGLRGFGRLLREGRLTKTEAGTYALTETSPMLAQAKRRAS